MFLLGEKDGGGSPPLVRRRRFPKKIKEQVIYEITWDDYKTINNILKGVDGKDLSFYDTFGDDKRIMIPFKSEGATSEIKTFIEFFQDNGYDLDFSTGLATREIEIPAGPKKGQKQKKGIKIGKLLEKVVSLRDSYRGSARTPQGKKDWANLVKLVPDYAMTWGDEDSFSDIDKLQGFWNKKSEYYRKHPDAVGKEEAKYSIIISRHPVDVLRMSDFAGIQSCHSPGSGYWDCAVEEAQGHGLIAYVVENSELPEDFDVQRDEIFADAKRDIAGITPLSRLRLRKYVVDDGEYEMAAPEARVYGRQIPGFKEAVLKWSRENQREVKKIVSGKKDAPDFSSIERHGGSYGDSNDGRILNKLFKDGDDGPYRSSRDVSHAEGEEGQNLLDEYEEESATIQNDFDRRLSHSSVYYEVEEAEPGHVYVMFGGGMDIEFPEDELEGLPSEWRELAQVSRALQDAMYKADIYGIEEIEVDSGYGDKVWVRLRASTQEYEANPDGFSAFAHSVEELDEEYRKVEKIIKEFFIEEGYMEPSEHYKAKEKLTDLEAAGDKMFKNFEADVDEDDDEINFKNEKPIYIDLKGYDKTYPKQIEKVFAATEELFLGLLENLEAKIRLSKPKQLSIPGIDEKDVEDFVPDISKLDISVVIRTDKIRRGRFGKDPIPEALGEVDIHFMSSNVYSDKDVLSVFSYVGFMDEHYQTIQKMVQDCYNKEVQRAGLKPGGISGKFDITKEYERQVEKGADDATRRAVSGQPGGHFEINDYTEYTKAVEYSYFNLGRIAFINELAGNISQYLKSSKRWVTLADTMFVFVRNFFKAVFIELKRQIQRDNKSIEYIALNLYSLSESLSPGTTVWPFWDAFYEAGFNQKYTVKDNESLFEQYPELRDYISTTTGTFIIPIKEIKESKIIVNSVQESNKKIQRVVNDLVKSEKAVELVKLMKPLDVAKVIAVDLELCPKDAARATMGLIKRAHSVRGEGFSMPAIETNKEFPVPAALKRKDQSDKEMEEVAGMAGKVDITPKFVFYKHQFPPDPRDEVGDWPYDDMTTAGMKPDSKSRKRPLTTGKEPKKTVKYDFKAMMTPDLRIHQPGGDGGGGGGIYQKSIHSKDNSMSTAGNRTWNRHGTPGWSRSLADKEFDPPDEKKEENREDDELNFEKDAPVGSRVPMFFGGSSVATRKGFRKK